MNVTHLLDTDVVIEVLRRRSRTMQARFEAVSGSVAVSSVTAMELHYGVARSPRGEGDAAAVRQLFEFVPVLDFGGEAAVHAGRIRAQLAETGRPICAYDVMIAGQARSMGLTVATGNVREFSRVPGLVVEDWLA